MEWLNYHHLLYFWTVAREGGLMPAGKVLRLSHSTLSAQIHALETALGEQLFTRVGRKLELTEMGRIVWRYADEIFTLGRELVETVQGRSTGHPLRFTVGIVDVVPKLVVARLLAPALELDEPVQLVCREAPYDSLLAELATHALDLVVSDAPVPAGSHVRAYHHLLEETGVTLFGTRELVKEYREGFPDSLAGAPVVLPLEQLPLRRALDQWFERVGVTPRVVAACEDSALLKTLGAGGIGLFPGATVMTGEIESTYGVRALGSLEGVSQRFYAISVERRLKHPAVVAITETARQRVFADRRSG
ncbi:MAG: LysR family transcriptional regulator [Polyangiaceae bacterium]|nr:LysR family transcriptional regulator [Polyangiaceae bacterium]